MIDRWQHVHRESSLSLFSNHISSISFTPYKSAPTRDLRKLVKVSVGGMERRRSQYANRRQLKNMASIYNADKPTISLRIFSSY
jgi:hypothetical protein